MRTKTYTNGETPTPETITNLTSSTDLRTDSNTTGEAQLVSQIKAQMEADRLYNQNKLAELQAYNNVEGQEASTESIQGFERLIYKQEKWLETLEALDQNAPIPEGTIFYNSNL